RNKAFDEALAVLTPLLKDNENNISLHLLKLQLDSQMGDLDMLVADYEKLVELRPDDNKVKFALAGSYLKANKIKQGENLLRSLVESKRGVVETELALLNYLYSVDSKDAFNQLDVFVKNNKDNTASLTVYSKWLLSKNELSAAKKVLNTIITQNDREARDEARLILAGLEMSEKSFDKALEYIDRVERDSPSNQEAKLLKAQVLFNKKQYSDAKTVVEAILWQKPRMDQALSLLGSIYLVQGDLDKAYINYKEALKISPKNLVALNYIVSKEVREKHVDYAIELLERALRYLPSQLNILTQLVELYGDKKQWKNVDKYIDRVSRDKNGDVLSAYLRAKALYKKNECEKAVVSYAELLEKSPWVNYALVGMAECYSVLKQQMKMDDYLNGFIKKNPNMLSAYLLKSQIMVRSKHYKKAIGFLRNSLKNNSLSSSPLYSELARLYALVGDKDAEYKAYVDGLSSAPNNMSLLLRLAAYYEQAKVFDKAIEQYKRILAINSRHPVAKNNLATIYLDHYGDADHVSNALQLSDAFKQSLNPYFLDTYGWAQLKNGDMDTAIAVLKKVIEIAPDIPVFRYHLAVGYHKLGDKLAAISELKQAIQLGKGKVYPERKMTEELLAELK
ncbi:MAG: tetratricopeptide repeat protein, partial [Methylomarinum sp.]|nr:tetratricopeptide repeat protein [Methylomarinum sp.]